MDQNEVKLVETKVVNFNGTRLLPRPPERDDLWDDESTSHPERTSLRCEDSLPFPYKLMHGKMPITESSLTNQLKRYGSRERNIGNLVMQNTRYGALNHDVYKKPSSASHLDMLLPSTDVGSTRALAGLIVMCNDRVRKSFFKHGVLGVPLGRKPILDKIDASTILFLFEFEARALWGIYQASSQVNIDIEKDAYRGSETAFPAQVKFRILKKCRPLPEKLFKIAIVDNYYSPMKFDFELTDEQVTFLTRLYYLRDAEKLRIDSRPVSSEEATIPYEATCKERLLEEALYQEGVKQNGRNKPDTQRSRTTSKLPVRGSDNPEANTSVPVNNITRNAEYGYGPSYFFWHPKDLPIVRTRQDHSHVLSNQALKYSISDEQKRGCISSRVDNTLLKPRTTSLYRYPHTDEDILSENDLRIQLCQSKLFHYDGNPTYEEDTNACIQSPHDNLPDAAMGSNAKTQQCLNEEYYLHMLKAEQLKRSIDPKLLPSRSAPLHRANSASDVALWNLHLHQKKSLNPVNHHMELAPASSELQAWQMRESLESAGNGHTVEALAKRHLISPGDGRAQIHDYSAEGSSARGKACTQAHDYIVDGFSAEGKASACTRIGAPPEEEARQDHISRKRLMTSRSKSTQAVEVGNTMCAKCCISKRETSHSDEHWLDSILHKAKDYAPKRHNICDEGAWLDNGGHVVNSSSASSKSCDGVHEVFQNEEEDIPAQADKNGVLELHSRHQKPSVAYSNVADNTVEGAKPPRISVWSRLSTSRNGLNCRENSNSNENMQIELNDLFYFEASPSQRKVEAQPTDESEEEKEACSAFVEDGVNVQFKRRKLGTLRTADPTHTSQEQVGVNDSTTSTGRTSFNKRRKIRRPL